MTKFKCQILVVLALSIVLFSCGDEGPSVPNTPSNPLKGVYILYVGSQFTTDYAYLDAASNTITDNVFSNSNGGRTLEITPGDMKLNNNRDLYITAIGDLFAYDGTIYKINSETSEPIDSLRFGRNPYGFVINNNSMVVSSLGGSFVSILDLDFNVIEDSIEVGTAPAGVIYGMNKYVVAKNTFSSEKSVAFVDEVTSQVTKLHYPTDPVSVLFNVNGFFVSTFNSKKIYRVDRENIQTVDSFTVPTTLFTIEDLIFKTQQKFFVTAGSREVWECQPTTSGMTFRLIFSMNPDVFILNAAYEQTKNELYIADRNNVGQNGEVIVADAETGIVKRTYQLGGMAPFRFAFKY